MYQGKGHSFSYSHADEALSDQLEKQLAILKRQGLIETWHDWRTDPGQEFGDEIDIHVENDQAGSGIFSELVGA